MSKLACLFGFHTYTDVWIKPNGIDPFCAGELHLCPHCRQFGMYIEGFLDRPVEIIAESNKYFIYIFVNTSSDQCVPTTAFKLPNKICRIHLGDIREE